jgi:FtsP/CotA-like multicopper oxidase with cupredoxin domain
MLNNLGIILIPAILACVPIQVLAQGNNSCPRFTAGSAITQPPNLLSADGVLSVAFTYQTRLDDKGNTLYCYTTTAGAQSPTLRVHPGDHLKVSLQNAMPASPTMPGMSMTGSSATNCGPATMMTFTSVNLHYHGTNTAPVCHQDEVITTLVNSGQSYGYDLQIPSDEPPGLYWYHPHVHGIAEAAVQGGASGAIVVEGIENINPIVAGLPEQVLIIRDNPVPGNPPPGGDVPSWDVSLNYVPIPSPRYTPGTVLMKPSEKQFWRVLNASADTIIDLRLQYDGVAQPLAVVALDGVPTGSQDGTAPGSTITMTDILVPPAGRAEFVMTGPSSTVKNAMFLTGNINTGPDGDYDPLRPLASIKVNSNAVEPPVTIPAPSAPPPTARFGGLANATTTAQRHLYFSEVLQDPNNPSGPTNFYITVDGQPPTLFSPDNPPAIITTQGSVEDWTIENRALENHEFHIHQIHFLLLARNGVPVSAADSQFFDTTQIPFWSGSGPYPSIKVRMDFRGSVVGDFVYHCHILGHEDNGMMAIIRVLPAPSAALLKESSTEVKTANALPSRRD